MHLENESSFPQPADFINAYLLLSIRDTFHNTLAIGNGENPIEITVDNIDEVSEKLINIYDNNHHTSVPFNRDTIYNFMQQVFPEIENEDEGLD